jgi:D-alanyl-D-alanine carboxypeptidase
MRFHSAEAYHLGKADRKTRSRPVCDGDPVDYPRDGSAAANEKYAAIVVDANTGKTLYEDSADEKRYPASLTKMMTLFVLFEELKAGKFTLQSELSVSANAAAQAPSKLSLRAGSKIKVEDAILALTTKSANDASVVVAENVSGSVSQFAERMTRTARALGMNQSTFRNPNGLPNSSQFTSARDMAKLGAALQDRFPQYYKFFSARSFTWKGKKLRNHNRLLGSVAGVDGIKTGYTRASGFNLVSNVRRDGRHIIAVVMGGKTGASRDAHMRDLIAKHLPPPERAAATSLCWSPTRPLRPKPKTRTSSLLPKHPRSSPPL